MELSEDGNQEQVEEQECVWEKVDPGRSYGPGGGFRRPEPASA